MLITRGHLFAALTTALCLSATTAHPGNAESIYLEDFPDPAGAMLSNEIVAIMAPGLTDCPPPQGNWGADKALGKIGGVEPPGSATVCVYKGDDDPAFIQNLEDGGLLDRFGMDMLAVVPAAPEPVLKPLIWRPLLDHFESQAGKVPLFIAHGEPTVWLSVIDTTPTRDKDPELYPGRAGHGHSLLNMAKNLLCATPTGECISRLTSRLALAYYVDPDYPHDIVRDVTSGGDFGSMLDLARAIHDEVAAWQDEDPHSRLILNLSVGWDARYGGLETKPSDMPAPVELVYRAIRDAACRGALIVAAAGNDVGGSVPGGAWLPAAWHARARPDRATCEALVGKALDPDDFPGGVTVPLVESFSGVRWDSRQLSNASPASESQIVFYADHAVAEDRSNKPTKMLTGSSVSALLASVTAAAVSYYWDDLPRYKIMQFLYQSGRDLGRPADLCFGAQCPENDTAPSVRWTSLCRALTAACPSSSLSCHSLPGCDTLGKSPPDLPSNLGGVFEDSTPMPESLSAWELTEAHVPDPICGVAEQSFHPDWWGHPINPCPGRQRFNHYLVRPSVQPGPQSIPCPSCVFLLGDDTLLIEIDPDFREELTEATLTACGNSYRLPFAQPLYGGDKASFHSVGVLPSCTDPVKLSFTVGGLSSTFDPILVIP